MFSIISYNVITLLNRIQYCIYCSLLRLHFTSYKSLKINSWFPTCLSCDFLQKRSCYHLHTKETFSVNDQFSQRLRWFHLNICSRLKEVKVSNMSQKLEKSQKNGTWTFVVFICLLLCEFGILNICLLIFLHSFLLRTTTAARRLLLGINKVWRSFLKPHSTTALFTGKLSDLRILCLVSQQPVKTLWRWGCSGYSQFGESRQSREGVRLHWWQPVPG